MWAQYEAFFIQKISLFMSFFPSSQSQLLIQFYSLFVGEIITSQVWSCCYSADRQFSNSTLLLDLQQLAWLPLFVQAPGIRRLLLVVWHLKSLCQSQPSPGQHNPFHLWLSACAAPKVAVNAVCHITLQPAQSSHADLWLPKDKHKFLKCPPLCSLSVCSNDGASKGFKATCNIQSELRSMLSWMHITSLYESATNSCLLEEDGLDPPTAEQKLFPTAIKAAKMVYVQLKLLKIMVYVHPVPEADHLHWWLLH